MRKGKRGEADRRLKAARRLIWDRGCLLMQTIQAMALNSTATKTATAKRSAQEPLLPLRACKQPRLNQHRLDGQLASPSQDMGILSRWLGNFWRSSTPPENSNHDTIIPNGAHHAYLVLSFIAEPRFRLYSVITRNVIQTSLTRRVSHVISALSTTQTS